MDTAKLEGIVSAIEAESKIPMPSHANLARLVSMFFRELLEQVKPVEVPEKAVKEKSAFDSPFEDKNASDA